MILYLHKIIAVSEYLLMVHVEPFHRSLPVLFVVLINQLYNLFSVNSVSQAVDYLLQPFIQEAITIAQFEDTL
jgi:hypothetical protein